MDNAPSERYEKRYIVNAVLFIVDGVLGWLWFMGHVRPYLSLTIFGGVNVLAIVLLSRTLLGSVVDLSKYLPDLRPWLHKESSTGVLAGLLPLIAIAYLTTFTLTLTAGKDSNVNLRLKWRDSSREVSLSPGDSKTVTYFGLGPVTPQIETLAPSGFRPFDRPIMRGIPTKLAVPAPESKKTFYLVRLIPLYDLFSLRGRREPDRRYTLRVFVPGAEKPIEHAGLSFRALYLGASLADLQGEAKGARKAVNELRNKLLGYDDKLSESDIESILADWLDNPQFIPTRELKPGDRLRVVVAWPAGTSETTVDVASTLNDGFLRGSAE